MSSFLKKYFSIFVECFSKLDQKKREKETDKEYRRLRNLKFQEVLPVLFLFVMSLFVISKNSNGMKKIKKGNLREKLCLRTCRLIYFMDDYACERKNLVKSSVGCF